MPTRISEMPAAVAQPTDIVPIVRPGTSNLNMRVDAADFLSGSTQAVWGGTASGTANALTLAPALPWTVYQEGARIQFVAGPTANTGAATLSVSGLSPVSLRRASGGQLVGGDLAPGELQEAVFIGGQFRLLPPTNDELHINDFGAVADGVTDNTAAMDAWWAAVNATRKVGVLGPGTYRCNSAITWQLIPNSGIIIRGAGSNATIIDVRAAPATADGGCQFLLRHTSVSYFYGSFSGFAIIGNNPAGPAVRFGRSVASTDRFNGVIFSDMELKNIANSASAIALELNGHFNCDFQAITTNTGGTRVAGTSLRINRAAFCRFFGSFSGADVGLLIDGTFSFANLFTALNVEEVNVGVRVAGSNNSRNTFVGGTFGANTCLDFEAGSGVDNIMFMPNLAPYSGGTAFDNLEGVIIVGVTAAAAGNLNVGSLRAVSQTSNPQVIINALPAFSPGIIYQRNNLTNYTVDVNSGSSLVFTRHNPATGAAIEATMRIDGSSGDVVALRTQAAERFMVPSYNVASLPSASPARQVIYVPNESGGAVLAFSDGTNWRRVTDRAIVS